MSAAKSIRRRGTSALALALILAVGLVSLGLAGTSLARSAELAVPGRPGMARARRPVAEPVETKEPEPTPVDPAPAPPREAQDLASVLSAGPEPLSGWTLFGEQGLCVAGSARVEGAERAARVGGNGDLWVRGGGAIAGDALPGPRGRVRCERPGAVAGRAAKRGDELTLPRVDLPQVEGRADLRLAAGETRALPSGDRGQGAVVLEDGATLELTGPARLVVQSLALGAGARISVDGRAGAVELHVLGDFALGSGAELGTPGGEPGALLVHLAADTFRGTGAVIDLTAGAAGRGGRIDGVVYAPEALVVVDGDFVLRGALIAGAARIDERARVVGVGR